MHSNASTRTTRTYFEDCQEENRIALSFIYADKLPGVGAVLYTRFRFLPQRSPKVAKATFKYRGKQWGIRSSRTRPSDERSGTHSSMLLLLYNLGSMNTTMYYPLTLAPVL